MSEVQFFEYGEPSFALTKNIGVIDFAEARKKVEEGLKEEGFGVLTEIDVTATLKKKIDVDFQPYLILGACNPNLAYQAITADPGIGTLLPCNVVLCGHKDGSISVSAIDPEKMFMVVDRSDIEPIAHEVKGKLQKVLDNL